MKIRLQVYKRMIKENFKIHCFREDDRISIILNGLKDPDNNVVFLCKQYLVQQICLKDYQESKLVIESRNEVKEEVAEDEQEESGS